MNVQTRCVTAILPVFLLLALSTAVLMFFLERHELEWGIREEAAEFP
jgi:hypothetical protein